MNNNYNYNTPHPNNFYSGQSYPTAPQFGMPQHGTGGYQPQMPLSTNIERVTSLEEALFKSNTRNSDTVYFDQNKPVIYRIKVEIDGTKSYAILPYTLPEQANNAPATKAEVEALAAAVQELSIKVEKGLAKTGGVKPIKRKGEEVLEDESNG